MKNIFIVFVLFILLSCENKTHVRDFNDQISIFDIKIKKHFPSKIPTYYSSAVFHDNFHDIINILLKYKYENKIKYKLFIDSISALSKIKYKSNDSCLLVINRYTDEKNYFSSFKAMDNSYYNQDCLKSKLPIPNFWALKYNAKNISKLPKGFNIFVFESSHDTLNEKYLSKNVYVPNFWKHGYSRGIAVNDSTLEIIYWFIIW